MRHFILLTLFLFVFNFAFAGWEFSQPAVQAADLQPFQGQYFRLSIPSGWQVNETANGIDVAAQDGVTGYSFIMLMGGFGYMTPQNFLMMRLQSGPYMNPQFYYVRDLPDQPGPMGMPWKVIEAELQFGYMGVPVRTHVTCGVIQGAGQYSAVMRAYQIPQQNWAQMQNLLAQVDSTLLVTNPQQVAGLDKVQLPKGTSHDEMFGSYNKGYGERQRSSDRSSKARREGTMGTERVKDPVTGQIYDMPTQNYDPTIGGYRNPNRPTEILVPTDPGE